MAETWLAGAEVIAGNDGGTMTGQPWRGVLHTTEGSTAAGAIGTFTKNNSWPHLTIEWPSKRIIQHLSLDIAARSLQHPVGTVETNRANCVQIELVGNAVDAPGWSADRLEFIASVMRMVEAAVPIPRQSGLLFKAFPASAGLANGVRLSDADWLLFTGWCGHQHVPRQDHGDPGQIDIGYLCSPRILGVGSSQSTPGPFVVARTPYALDAILGRLDRPWAQAWSGSWESTRHPVGDGVVSPAPISGATAVARNFDVVDAFWVGPDGSLNTSWWTRVGGWSATRLRIGDPLVPASTDGGIVALGRQTGILDVFFVGQDLRLRTTWWTADSGWSPTSLLLAGAIEVDSTGGVAVINRHRDILEVFFIGTDGLLYVLEWLAQTGWATSAKAVGGTPVLVNAPSGCAVVAPDPSHLTAVYVGLDSALYSISWTRGTNWSPPVRLGGASAPIASRVAGPAIVSRRSDVIDVFWLDPTGHLYTTWWTKQAGWNEGSLLISNPGTPLNPFLTPAAVARQPGILDVFVVDLNYVINTIWWTEQNGWAAGFLGLSL